MIKQKKTQLERNEETKRREANLKFSESMPSDAFSDDPVADSYDKNGKVDRESASTLMYGGVDLGRFPPNG